jgi:hypothetical protein
MLVTVWRTTGSDLELGGMAYDPDDGIVGLPGVQVVHE